jgi:hypothetical protein
LKFPCAGGARRSVTTCDHRQFFKHIQDLNFKINKYRPGPIVAIKSAISILWLKDGNQSSQAKGQDCSMKWPQAKALAQKILFFGVFSFLFSAQAADLSLSDQLIQKFQSRTSVLDREMITFRYETKANFEPRNQDEVRGRVYGWPERFLDIKVMTGDLAGPGTYLAIDPFASRSFGGGAPQLYVIPLTKGTRVLDLQSSLKADEKEIIKNIHRSLQCKKLDGTGEKLIDENNMDYFSLRRSSTEACRAVAIRVIQTLKTQAIFYGYSASNSLAECRERSAAINVISSQVLDFSKALFYSDESAIESAEMGKFIKRAYDESNNDFSLLLNSGNNDQMPLGLSKKPMALDSEYHQWKKEKVYACGPKWAPENPSSINITSSLRENYQANFQDSEIESLILQLKKSFDMKAQNKDYFNLTNFMKIMRLNFAVSGLPQDESTFKRWAYLTKNSYTSPENLKELKALYGIDKTLQELVAVENEAEEFLKKMTATQIKSPDLYPKLLAHFGIKGGYVYLSMNEMNLYRGGAILVSMDRTKSISENLQISKGIFKEALKECVKMYSDQTLTYEDIQKTDCSIKNRWE